MVSDQELAKGIETVLRQADPNSVTSLDGVVQQLEAKLGLSLSHKAGFIHDQINLLLRSHPTTVTTTATAVAVTQQPHRPPQPQPQPQPQPHPLHLKQNDHFALQHHPQFQQFPAHFTLHPHQQQVFPQDLNFRQPPAPLHPPPPQQQQQQQRQQPPPLPKSEVFSQNATPVPPELSKESAPVGAKRRGGPGGLNKVCGVSPELQAIVGEPALPRTEIVKQLWAYIRKNNLQDPSNKRKIICDDALRVVFETDCTDMFKMNKLLAKHIIPLEPTKETGQAKRVKVDVESTTESSEPGASVVLISEALAKFFGTAGREMTQLEASRLVWEYIKVNQLEDPLNSMVILCDAKLRELLGCESISAVGVEEMLARHHLFKKS
ncbi:hypothetical protein P3X46_009045 [Hevea brasiliensis]|uniref:DM2 domain-containing protein n=1 Tax=Hevea brasiliensis TaxID=3981 RepID=A0ABQ9MPP2_HEVBR|nr:uncharacterized protein LOC110664393 [Hevea brasiliensis]KAJ9180847.1 hypothetical protein P3X46_009045 [Hevea brasiliensis]KAJ9180848.1 hypothetical protein P3X46_009045 [Hevea brasiliensis]